MPKPPATDFDVIIVGAGPAGTAAAYDLCLAGKSVLLLDRHSFPRHKACAGGLTVKTLKALRYPVGPVIKNRCRSLEIGKGFSGAARFSGSREICAMTVRSELDAFCLAKTRTAGARFQSTGRIQAIREKRNFVDIQTAAGRLRTAFLIGADGAHSCVRKLSGEFLENYQGFAIEGTLPLPPSSAPRMAFDFNVNGPGYGWSFPKDNHVNIGLFTGRPNITLKKDNLRAYALRKLGRTDIQNISGHPMGLGGWNYRPHCRRILLAGDAAGLVDPLLGEGLYNAVRSGQFAAQAIIMSEPHNKTAGTIYDGLLKGIRRDLQFCRLAAAWFYRVPNFGHWVLTSSPVKYALMKGFALGWPLGRIGAKFYLLPFLTSCKKCSY